MTKPLRRLIPPLVAIGILVIVWYLLTVNVPRRERLFPVPTEVLTAFVQGRETLLNQHIPTTLAETLIGLSIALVFGLALAAGLDYLPIVKRALYPLLVLSQTIPIIAIAPALILMFGFGIEPKIVVVVLFCFFPITVAVVDGLSATDPDYVALLRAMGASRRQIWWKVRYPSALPALFSGLRIAATYSVSGAVVGEFISAQAGLGQYLRIGYSQNRMEQVFAAIFIISALSIALVALVSLVEHMALPWFFTEARQSNWNEPGIY